jgi:hypothetical protein
MTITLRPIKVYVGDLIPTGCRINNPLIGLYDGWLETSLFSIDKEDE